MYPALLLAAAQAKDPPLIDLDSTVFLQLAIFIVTALALSKFLFAPYLAVRAARAAGSEGARDEAARFGHETKARQVEYEASLTKSRLKATEERQRLRAEASEREREILEAARQKLQATLDEARARLEADTIQARTELVPRAQEIARAMARKILGQEVA